ncbi:MAG: HEAT repeat domain-containing protein, partial [Pyrinomonadaceae bacterium]|nr:HEAT repeat domain-containing protein [Pyrinomonadaceae bacterium]
MAADLRGRKQSEHRDCGDVRFFIWTVDIDAELLQNAVAQKTLLFKQVSNKIQMKTLFLLLATALCFVQISAQNTIQQQTSILIIKAEDERRFDKDLQELLKSSDAKTRRRAVLASGRIGDEKAVPFLTEMLAKDADAEVKAMSAFALGEIESGEAGDALLKVLETKDASETRARAIEALGKIAAANPKNTKVELWKRAISDAADFESSRRPSSDKKTVLLCLTAVLRAKPEAAETVAAKFLIFPDARIKADALNVLARLRVKNEVVNAQVRQLLSDANGEVRANAARVLGGAEDKSAFDTLLKIAENDVDGRARVSAIRALSNLKNKDAANVLLNRSEKLLSGYKLTKVSNPDEKSELLEISTALGQILKGSN